MPAANSARRIGHSHSGCWMYGIPFSLLGRGDGFHAPAPEGREPGHAEDRGGDERYARRGNEVALRQLRRGGQSVDLRLVEEEVEDVEAADGLDVSHGLTFVGSLGDGAGVAEIPPVDV